MLAAVKACGPAAILSHMPAATLWGFADRDEERAPEVTVIGDGARSHPGIRIHRTARIDRCDWRMWQAIPVTTPARTMLDISATVDGKPLRSLVRRAQGTGSVGLRQLCEVVERLGPRKGSRRLALAIVGGPAPTRSVLEDMVLDLLLDGGFERPDINRPIVVGGRRVIPDFRWPEQHLIVEAARRRVARRQGGNRGRRRASSAARGARRAGYPRHLAPGPSHPRANPTPNPSRGCPTGAMTGA
jgi:hypothetical protein